MAETPNPASRYEVELRRRIRALVVDTSPPETDPRVAHLIHHWDIPPRQARDMIAGLAAFTWVPRA